ncbi:MAG: plastocyanin/azurin family copper-binding protein [Sterolibacteriaceae bacterium MAG5]|nr:plastocyanin/azurin family copper-binding protein [Candidatus Nitricoxidireducens bremensis]
MRIAGMVPPLLFAAAAWAQGVVEVQVRDYRFEPAEVKIRTGTTVRWTNGEKRVSHSVFFSGPGGFESERIFPGESYQRLFDKPGRYPYGCGPHPEMKGLVEVVD